MEAGIGVNSPEFLQKKIERLKTALDEANVLMDRHVTERDAARAQLDALKRENAELRSQLEQAQAGGGDDGGAEQPSAEQTTPVDPTLERHVRERIAQLEGERDALEARTPAVESQQDGGQIDDLRREMEAMRAELDAARREMETSRADAEASRADAEASRADADASRANEEASRADADAARREAEAARSAAPAPPTPVPVTPGFGAPDLPSPAPFVSHEVIRDALDNDNFVLFCQPVFSLQSERITQYELLLRLRDEDGRMVRPLGFLEPADRYGLMAEIDRWVVTRALDMLERDPTGELRLEVNIGAQSLADHELTSMIEQHIAMSDLDPARLIIEISENIAAANLEACEQLAKRLRGMGCGFALDHFGSTFASFRHLRDLPINFLKIDGDLIVTVTESRTGQLTVKSLVELARGLGAETVAEYVSDDQTLEFLREQGVGYAQGYRIGRPRPIDDVLGMQAHEQPAPTRVERPALEPGHELGDVDVTPSETT